MDKKDELPATFGARLKLARKRARLKQEPLARKVGMSQSNLSDLENDKYPSSSFTAQLADAMGVSGIWLAEGRGPMMLRTLSPHEARLLADSEGVENKRKPQLFEDQIHSVTLYAYPIVTLDELRGGVVVDRENQEFMRGRETDVCDREPGRHDFAVRVQDDSMNGGQRPIPAGTVVFIEATDEAAPGEIVLIQMGSGAPILRTLVADGDGYQLMPSASGMQGKALPAKFKMRGVAFSWNVKVPMPSTPRTKLAFPSE